MKIEKLKMSDWKKFYNCFKQILEEDFFHYPPKMIQRLLKEERIKKNWGKSKEILVGLRDKDVVGFLIAVDSGGGVSYCNWLGVKKELRNKGLGSKLVKTWQKWAKRRSCHKLRAQTSKGENQSFYERLGFKLEGIKKNDRYHLDHFIFGKII